MINTVDAYARVLARARRALVEVVRAREPFPASSAAAVVHSALPWRVRQGLVASGAIQARATAVNAARARRWHAGTGRWDATPVCNNDTVRKKDRLQARSNREGISILLQLTIASPSPRYEHASHALSRTQLPRHITNSSPASGGVTWEQGACRSISQSWPAHRTLQRHRYCAARMKGFVEESLHAAPFWHGSLEHSSMSTSHVAFANPARHAQENVGALWLEVASSQRPPFKHGPLAQAAVMPQLARSSALAVLSAAVHSRVYSAVKR